MRTSGPTCMPGAACRPLVAAVRNLDGSTAPLFDGSWLCLACFGF